MSDLERLFREADRLMPPPGLWNKIEAQVGLKAGRPAPYQRFGGYPALRLAASVALVAGLLGIGALLQKKSRPIGSGSQAAGVAPPGRTAPGGSESDSVWIDPDLFSWHADLGELEDSDEEAGEAGEIL